MGYKSNNTMTQSLNDNVLTKNKTKNTPLFLVLVPCQMFLLV